MTLEDKKNKKQLIFHVIDKYVLEKWFQNNDLNFLLFDLKNEKISKNIYSYKTLYSFNLKDDIYKNLKISDSYTKMLLREKKYKTDFDYLQYLFIELEDWINNNLDSVNKKEKEFKLSIKNLIVGDYDNFPEQSNFNEIFEEKANLLKDINNNIKGPKIKGETKLDNYLKSLNKKLKKNSFSIYEGLIYMNFRISSYEYLILNSSIKNNEIKILNSFKYVLGMKYLINKKLLNNSEIEFLKNDGKFMEIINTFKNFLKLKSKIHNIAPDGMYFEIRGSSEKKLSENRIFSGCPIIILNLLESKENIQFWVLFDKNTILCMHFYGNKNILKNEFRIRTIINSRVSFLNTIKITDKDKSNLMELDCYFLFNNIFFEKNPHILLNLKILNNDLILEWINYTSQKFNLNIISNENISKMRKILSPKNQKESK